MFDKKWSRVFSLIIMASAIMLVAACAPVQPAAAPPQAPAATAAPAAVVATQPAADTRGTLVLRGTKTSFPKNFNPLLYDVRVWLYDGLVRFDPDMKPIPDLADSWDISPDGLVYTFKLHPGVKFHDGVEMTAEDVVYSAQLVLDEKNNSPYRSKFVIGGKPVKWEVVDKYTVKATLPAPSSSFLAKVSRADEIFFAILPKHLLEKCSDIANCDFNQHPVGTGPFKLTEYVANQRAILDSFDDYFKGKPGVKRVVRLFFANEQSGLAALKAGEIDGTSLQEAGNVKVAEADPNITIHRYNSNWIMAARFNQANPLAQDVKVRQAIAYAVDRPSLVKAAIGPTTKAGDSPISNGWAASPDVVKYAYDPAKAKQLLDEAGWVPGPDGIRVKDGKKLSFEIVFDQNYGKPDLAAGMQQYLKAVGVDLKLKQLEAATAEQTIYSDHQFDMYLDWQGFGVDPDIASRWMTSETTAGNYLDNPTGYSNPEVDAAFKAAAVAPTLEERQKQLWKAQELITADAPAVWLDLWEAQMAVSKNVGGLSLPPSDADMDNTGIFREPWKVTSQRP
jgi:peptide/nickel transport system substrate-binding protein